MNSNMQFCWVVWVQCNVMLAKACAFERLTDSWCIQYWSVWHGRTIHMLLLHFCMSEADTLTNDTSTYICMYMVYHFCNWLMWHKWTLSWVLFRVDPIPSFNMNLGNLNVYTHTVQLLPTVNMSGLKGVEQHGLCFIGDMPSLSTGIAVNHNVPCVTNNSLHHYIQPVKYHTQSTACLWKQLVCAHACTCVCVCVCALVRVCESVCTAYSTDITMSVCMWHKI